MFSGKSLDFVVKTVVNTCRRINNVLMFLFVHFCLYLGYWVIIRYQKGAVDSSKQL